MIKEKAYAKINLALEVVKKRKDGFHDLRMINVPIELHDILEFEDADDIILESNLEIPNNVVIKTAKKMKKKFDVEKGAKISLTKNIPIGSGLGGESADIAATIRGLNRLWNLDMELEDLTSIALELGSDTVFCLYNMPAYVTGRGDKLFFLQPPKEREINLLIPNIQVSTKEVFENFTFQKKRQNFDKLIRLYLNEKYEEFFLKANNELEKAMLQTYPKMKEYKKKLKKINTNIHLSGSGSSYFFSKYDEIFLKSELKTLSSDVLCIKTHIKR